MNMSRNQVILASLGGLAAVGAVVFGYLVYAVSAERGETADELASAKDRVQRVLRADISADVASVAAVNKNRDVLVGWGEAALSTASAGDRAVRADVNEAAFKQKLVDEARALAKLPGDGGAIVKPDFAFGFPDFVTGDKLPEKERLPQLQRQWGDIRQLVEILSSCDVVEIVRIEPSAASVAVVPVSQQAKAPGGKKAKKSKAGDGVEPPPYTVETYAVDFRAKSASLVKIVNALAQSQRFFAVDALSFVREGDMIAAALGEGDKKSSDQQPTGRRRRRRGGEEPSAEAEAASVDAGAHKGVANDPALEAPFLVKAVISTYDFGTAPASAAVASVDEPSQEVAETDEKEEEE